MLKQALVLFLLVAAVFAETAYFAFKTYGSNHEFIIKLDNDERIKEARAILSGDEVERTHVFGRIKKQSASYNPHYSFYLDPATISFFFQAIEVCDATLSYVEEYIDEACGAFLPGCIYCPWSSKLTREVEV